jgi:hypothetical protein
LNHTSITLGNGSLTSPLKLKPTSLTPSITFHYQRRHQ